MFSKAVLLPDKQFVNVSACKGEVTNMCLSLVFVQSRPCSITQFQSSVLTPLCSGAMLLSHWAEGSCDRKKPKDCSSPHSLLCKLWWNSVSSLSLGPHLLRRTWDFSGRQGITPQEGNNWGFQVVLGEERGSGALSSVDSWYHWHPSVNANDSRGLQDADWLISFGLEQRQVPMDD